MEARRLVGWNVRRLRVAKLMTIEELAHRAGMDDSFLGRLERGQVNVGIVMLANIAGALGAKLTDLVIEPQANEKAPRPLPAGRKPRRPSNAPATKRPGS
jgi:transcriptional regulator with XRE-family HTH domain